MRNLFQSNFLFAFIATLVCIFIGLKTIAEYRNLNHVETKIQYEDSVILKQFTEAYRSVYINIFLTNHIPIDDKTIPLLPAVAISQISQEFERQTGSDVTVNTVTDRPRNPRNMVDDVEQQAMLHFKSNPRSDEYFKKIVTDNETYFFYASPLFIEASCIKCHGTQEDAIPSIRKKYSTAYGYQEGDLRGIISIKMRRGNIKKDLINLFFLKTTIATVIGSFLFLTIIFFLIQKVKRDQRQYTDKLEQTVQNKTRELREQVRLIQEYSKVLDASAIVSRGDLAGNITYVNDKMCEVYGYRADELIGQPHSILQHPDMEKHIYKNMWETVLAKTIWQGLVKNRKKDGSYTWAQSTICPIIDNDGEISEFIAARTDVTELVDKRQELQTLLTVDTLTGLPNRYQMLQDLGRMERGTVILVDIHNFGDINDFFGIETGDTIIAEFAHRLFLECVDRPCQLYRLQGDQVALLMGKKQYQQKELETIAERLMKSINQAPFIVNNDEIIVQVTCGIAWNLKNALIEADIALKQAKNNRRDYVINKESLHHQQELEKNHSCAVKIKNALQDNRVVTFYQPIVNAATGQTEKYECLVRIIEEDGSVVSPYLFLTTSKKTRVYTKITRAVIDNACAAFADVNKDFSINLSTEDILDPSVVEHLKNRLTESSLADRAILEILETEGFENYDQVSVFIREMKDMGCRIAIDDFGSGHSNYERLLNLQVDYLKIDGSIVKKITTDDISRTIVETIVAVARKLEIQTVAEFVFDEATAELATTLGVDYLQGYYFSEPVDHI